jgi:hypothetical protein
MSCFNSKNSDNDQINLPSGLEYNKLFPKYKIIKPENAIRQQLKGTRIQISDKIMENEYFTYSSKYPWIEVKCFELIQPKEKFNCIRITNKNTKNPKKIIIFSNGEMSNMCGILPILVDLSSYLKLNIITYEYPKTNTSHGINKKEQEMIESTLTIISFIYASPEYDSFILMGYSIGVYLNYKIIETLVNKSQKFTSKLKNVINISPMWCFDSTYAKKIFHSRKYSSFISNLIKNTNTKLSISTFVSHGVKDNKIGYMITMNICSRLNFIYEWYPKEGDHYNTLLKDTYKRKLFKRLKQFLSFENINTGNEFDNSIISRITNEGIKVNINKDLNLSSGNFFFEEKEEKEEKDKNKDKNNLEINTSNMKGKIKTKENRSRSRKESGFSFLDISIHKYMNNNNEVSEDINEIKNEEEDFDKDDNDDSENINDKNIIIIDGKDEEEGDDNNNCIENIISNVIKNDDLKNNDNHKDNDDNTIKSGKRGYLINDSFGLAPQDKSNYELSFRKDTQP